MLGKNIVHICTSLFLCCAFDMNLAFSWRRMRALYLGWHSHCGSRIAQSLWQGRPHRIQLSGCPSKCIVFQYPSVCPGIPLPCQDCACSLFVSTVRLRRCAVRDWRAELLVRNTKKAFAQPANESKCALGTRKRPVALVRGLLKNSSRIVCQKFETNLTIRFDDIELMECPLYWNAPLPVLKKELIQILIFWRGIRHVKLVQNFVSFSFQV